MLTFLVTYSAQFLGTFKQNLFCMFVKKSWLNIFRMILGLVLYRESF